MKNKDLIMCVWDSVSSRVIYLLNRLVAPLDSPPSRVLGSSHTISVVPLRLVRLRIVSLDPVQWLPAINLRVSLLFFCRELCVGFY